MPWRTMQPVRVLARRGRAPGSGELAFTRRFGDPNRPPRFPRVAAQARLPAMTQHGGDLIADVLARHGATHVFTLCGGHISPILTGAQARGLRVVDVRDEANA